MAVVGLLGPVTFSVSRGQVKTFQTMKWDASAKYATHDRHLKQGLLEYTGTDPDTLSMTMLFSVFLGTDPEYEIAKLLYAMRAGQVMRLVLGGYAYGSRWVADKVSVELQRHDNRGNLLAAKATVSLKSYAWR